MQKNFFDEYGELLTELKNKIFGIDKNICIY